MNQTAEQIAFRKAITDPNDHSNIVLQAVAGSGKTTTILSPLNDPELTDKKVALIAFNKAIAQEIKDKLIKMGIPNNRAQAGTCHSYGFKTFIKGNGSPKVDSNKVYQVTEEYFKQNADLPWIMKAMVRRLVSFGKQFGAGMAFEFNDTKSWLELIERFDVNDSDAIADEEIAKVAAAVLRKSNQIKNIIDFDDMIYLPLLQKLKFEQFDIVLADESQDLNWCRLEAASKMVAPGGRFIAVGDSRQSIYGFAGSMNDSMEQIKNKFNARELPLTYCFRSGKKIVEFAQKWNPIIQPSPNAIEGSVEQMSFGEFLKENLDKNSAMICRNTKPLVSTAFALLRAGIPAYVEGRDIGAGLIKLARRWKVVKIDAFIKKLDAWKDHEIEKCKEKDDEGKIQNILDQFDTMMVIVNRCLENKRHTVEDIVAEITLLFKDTKEGERPDCFTLCTSHRSKGREWDNVFWLDRAGTMPSKYAKKEWQLGQEYNLMYVSATRAKKRLVEVTP